MDQGFDCIPVSPLHRCVNCDKPYSTDGLSMTSRFSLSGGICFDCGRPALMDLVQDSLEQGNDCGFETENRNLENLLLRLKEAFEASDDLISKMKRAKQRSTEAALVHKAPIPKRLENAKAELRDLEELRSSMKDVGTVVSLEECARQLETDITRATRVLRQLQSTNKRRDLELSRHNRSVSTEVAEDQGRRDLISLRVLNANLSQSIEARQRSVPADLADAIKERDTLKRKLAALRLRNLENPVEQCVGVVLKSAATSPIVMAVPSSIPPLDVRLVNVKGSSSWQEDQVNHPDSASPEVHTVVRLSQKLEDEFVSNETIQETVIKNVRLVVVENQKSHDVIEDQISNLDVLEEDYDYASEAEKNILEPDQHVVSEKDSSCTSPSQISETSSFAFPQIRDSPSVLQVDEPVHSLPPRRLFQSETVVNEETVLGPSLDQSYLPPVHVPALFKVSPRNP